MRSAITVCLVPEARSGPFVFHGDLASGCTQAAATGFHAVEVFPPSADEIDAHLLRQLLRQHGLALAAVGTGAGWLKHRLSLTHSDSAVRHRAHQFVAALIDLAGPFGAPAIIGSMQGRAEGEVTRAQALQWLGAALEQLGPRASAHGVPLLLEPLNRYESNLLNTLDQTTDFLRSLTTRTPRILADLFHMNLEESSIPEALRRAGPLLGHVHFADSNRQAVGYGHTDVAAAIQTLKDIGYSGFLSAEILPLPTPTAAAETTQASIRRFLPA